MRVSLYLVDRILDFKLPTDISGSFSFGVEDDDKLINIEARDNTWFLYETFDVSVIYNNSFVKDIPLKVGEFYILRKDDVSYLIYISPKKSNNIITYSYNESLRLLIGNTDNSEINIRYNCIYLKDLLIKIGYKNNRLILEKSNNLIIYVNKKALKSKAYFIKYGDEIQLYGLDFIFLNGILLVRSVADKVAINLERANLSFYHFPVLQQKEDIEVKNIDLYSKDEYFSKSPRLRRIIETKKIKLSTPPRDGDSQELPLILVIGPMLTMGITAFTMILSTLTRISSGESTIVNSWPQLVTSGTMLVSMILWPLLTQKFNRKQKEKKKKEIVQKYTQYLNEKKAELIEEAKLQRIILFENLITVSECMNIISHRNINFWDKRIDQSDFLITRIGIGDELLDVDIEYPEEGFTIEENELRKKADMLVSEFQYLKNVPIGYSFYENISTAIMGPNNKTFKFMNNILLQLITFYSYEDLKIVVFTNDATKYNWEYIKYLNHNFTNDKSIRFFASNQDDTKVVSDYLGFEANNRLQNKGNNIPHKPHYFVLIDDYDIVKRHDFIKTVTESDENLGFSIVIIENRLSNLPSRCNNFITLGEKQSSLLKNSYENQIQIKFYDEIQYNIDMMSVSKALANIPIEFEEGIKQLPDSVTFLEMEKVGKVEQLNILNRWNTNDSTSSLRAEIGLNEEGYLMYLDLHEKFHGPHGLIAGMTGSGKSEFIITYILSMAINYSPDDISFILIDYKGGGLAGAFENKSTGMVLPHLSGVITNLDKAEMDRTLVSIDSEIKRRQEIFNSARDLLSESTIDIYKYQKFYKEGRLNEAVPHLFIICDEFAELKAQQPDFMDNLISVARIGRSLGVHLILATQKPSGVVNDQIWSNTKFRVCLKVQDESDSREMLKRPEAASLKQVGRFYLQVGYNEYFGLGQSAYCGAKYYPSEKIVKNVDNSVKFINDCGFVIKSIEASSNRKLKEQGEQLSSIMNSIIAVSNRVGKFARKLWLDNIPGIILESDLEKKYSVSNDGDLFAIIGEYDAPERQEQGLVKYNFLKDGNTIIYGNDGSEREMLLNTIIYSSCKRFSASDLNFYAIDYGSESLRRYINLPHMGGVVFSFDDEKYNNLIKLIKKELRERKKLFVDYGGEYSSYIKSSGKKLPIKVIIINNYDSLYENKPQVYEELPDIVRDSERYGIVYIFTANSANSIQSKISHSCPNVYTFSQKEQSDYATIFGGRTKIIPRQIQGRGLLNIDGIHEFQTASILEDSAKLNDYLIDFIKRIKDVNNTIAERIPTLPDVVRFSHVNKKLTGLNSVPIGISKNNLEVCTIDYHSILGNLISSNRLKNTEKFVKSLIYEVNSLSDVDVVIFDPANLLALDYNIYSNYYVDNIASSLDNVIAFIESLKERQSSNNGIIFIYNFSKFISKLGDNTKMTKLVQLLKDYEKFSIVAIDEVSKIKSYTFESWFNGIFNLNDGIWVGKGISDQNLFHLSKISKDMTFDYNNDMGYFVTESTPVLVRFIDFISENGENIDEE